MSWVLPLVGCGGPAVSRCGHETRRHRVRGALFASVFASVLLAACGGGGAGNDSVSTNYEPEPGPPGPGPLIATGDGGNESGEEQQQKIIVNQEEEQQQEIVVNIQPDNQEPEEESESESDNNDDEETPQQLTIIEEVVPEYREPEKPKPTYSAQQQSQPESEEESEKNNNEEQKIVVNIQPEPEESESEEEENNNEETPQQLTIVEEEVFEYREPEKPKPTYSAQQQSQPESEEESEKNNNEEQKIVVNIQPEPEESESEEEENNNEETPQQLTIVEEEVFEYREPEKPKPTYSAQQQSQPESEEESEENNNEEQKIVVNIQPEPEESESEEEENNNEETPQQLTIIEEEVFEHRPSEEPRYSAQTTSVSFPDRHQDTNYKTETYEVVGNIGDFSYWLEDAPNDGTSGSWNNRTLSVEFLSRNKKINHLTDRNPLNTAQGNLRKNFAMPTSGYTAYFHSLQELWETRLDDPNDAADIAEAEYIKNERKSRSERIIASYNKENGFVGAYIYKGEVGSFQSDVNLKFIYWPNRWGERLDDDPLLALPRIVGTIGNDLVMGGDDFRGFIVNLELDVDSGTFEIVEPQFGYDGGPTQPDGSRVVFWQNIYSGEGTITGVLSNDGGRGHSAEDLPNYLAGEVKVTGFTKAGESGAGNQLVGVFVGDKKSAFNDN